MQRLGEFVRHHESGHFRFRRAWTTTRAAAPDLLLVWNLAEDVDVQVGGWSGVAPAGTLVVFPPGVPHRYRPVPESGWEWLWLHVGGLAASDVAARLAGHGPVLDVGDHPRLRARFRELVSASTAAGPAPTAAEQLHLDSCAFSVLGLVVARAADGARWPATDLPPELERFTACVGDHLADPLTLADLARAAGCSTATLHRLARRHLGESPVAHLARRRMREATRLLADTDLTVAEIARRVGFADPLHFSRRYRRLHGRPPSAVRGDVPPPAPAAGRYGDAAPTGDGARGGPRS